MLRTVRGRVRKDCVLSHIHTHSHCIPSGGQQILLLGRILVSPSVGTPPHTGAALCLACFPRDRRRSRRWCCRVLVCDTGWFDWPADELNTQQEQHVLAGRCPLAGQHATYCGLHVVPKHGQPWCAARLPCAHWSCLLWPVTLCVT